MAKKRLQMVLAEMERLNQEALQLMEIIAATEDEKGSVSESSGTSEEGSKAGWWREELKIGEMVMVTRRDEYCRRHGRVIGRRGRLFWRVQLEADETEPSVEIYKMRHNLARIGTK